MGAVGIIPDTTDRGGFRDIVEVISVHPIILGSIEAEQRSLLSLVDVPDSLSFVTAPYSDSSERFIYQITAVEDIPEAFGDEVMIVCTSDAKVFHELCKMRDAGELDTPIFGIVETRAVSPNFEMKQADGFIFQFVPGLSELKQYQQLFLRASSCIEESSEAFHIGVISVQGDYRIQALELASTIENFELERPIVFNIHLVRTVLEIEKCDALLLPGGWSNLQSSIFDSTGIGSAIKRFDKSKKPILGVCAGMILAGARPGKDCTSRRLLRIADVTIENNAINGEHLVIDSAGRRFKSVFSNGPVAIDLGDTVERLAWLDNGMAVVVRDDNVLISACHRGEVVHNTFLEMCQRKWSEAQ
jgi:5'-phosphate synthase pdxT subunit